MFGHFGGQIARSEELTFNLATEVLRLQYRAILDLLARDEQALLDTEYCDRGADQGL